MEMTAGQPSSSIGRLTKNTRDSTKNISDPHSYLIIHPLDSRNHLWATTKYHIQVLKVLVEVVTIEYSKRKSWFLTLLLFKIKVLLQKPFEHFLGLIFWDVYQTLFMQCTYYKILLEITTRYISRGGQIQTRVLQLSYFWGGCKK